MTARLTALLAEFAPPTDITPALVVQPSLATATMVAVLRRTARPRRELLWVHDLEGVQTGVIS